MWVRRFHSTVRNPCRLIPRPLLGDKWTALSGPLSRCGEEEDAEERQQLVWGVMDSGLVGRTVFFIHHISRGDKMLYSGTDSEAYITGGVCGLWVVGCGLWGVGCGLWVVGCGLWVVGCGLWIVGYGGWGVGQV